APGRAGRGGARRRRRLTPPSLAARHVDPGARATSPAHRDEHQLWLRLAPERPRGAVPRALDRPPGPLGQGRPGSEHSTPLVLSACYLVRHTHSVGWITPRALSPWWRASNASSICASG